MCLCVYIYICIYTYMHLHIFVNTRMCAYTYACLDAHLHACRCINLTLRRPPRRARHQKCGTTRNAQAGQGRGAWGGDGVEGTELTPKTPEACGLGGLLMLYYRHTVTYPCTHMCRCFAVALGCRGRYFTTVIAQRLKTEGEDPKVRVAAGA